MEGLGVKLKRDAKILVSGVEKKGIGILFLGVRSLKREKRLSTCLVLPSSN